MFPSPEVEHHIDIKCPHCGYSCVLVVSTLGGRPPEKRLRKEKPHAVDLCKNPSCRRLFFVYPENAVWNR